MVTAVHIPFEELSSDVRALLERAKENGEIFIDGSGIHYKISRMPGRTAAESLELLQDSPDADVEVDDGWSNDMREIVALRHAEASRNPWE